MNNSKNCWTVYCHTTPSGKRYIGITSKEDPKKRWRNGEGYNNKRKQLFYKAIEKYGWENIRHEILDTNLDEFTAKCLEEYYIFSFRTFVGFSDCNGYNCTLGGEGTVGFKSSKKGKTIPDEIKKKISESSKGKNLGKHISEEHKIKISESMKGHIPWNSGKKTGISPGNKGKKGKPHTEEEKKKMSEAHIGKHWKLIDGKRVYYE